MKNSIKLFFVAAFAAASLAISPAASLLSSLQASATSSSTSVKKTTAKAAAPSSSDIADAKAKGMVWVNTSTHVYHKGDSSLYGTTKRGKFMPEDDAKKAGFRAANETGAAKKKLATAAATQK